MRQRRAKIYRKMLHQYHLQFGFREPYQLLIDDTFSLALSRYKISDPVHQFGNVLVSKKIKPLITQCSMQALYALGKEAQSTVDMAKQWERRMCNHREALPSADCIKQCVGPENKHRYIVASEQRELRSDLRLNVPGLPMMHFTQAVMVLEPMSALTKNKIEEKEETKLSLPASEKGLLKNQSRVEVDIIGGEAQATGETGEAGEGEKEGAKQGESATRRKRKAPNPLSMRKPKNPRLSMEEKLQKEQELKKQKQRAAARARMEAGKLGNDSKPYGAAAAGSEGGRRKRKRSNKSSTDNKPSQGENKQVEKPTNADKSKPEANSTASRPEGSAPPKKRRSRGKNNPANAAAAAKTSDASSGAAPAPAEACA